MGPEEVGRQGWVSTDDELNSAIKWVIPDQLNTSGDVIAYELLYLKDYDSLGPELSYHAKERLQETVDSGEETLVMFDPGQPGWQAHFEMWTRVSRPAIDSSVPRGIRVKSRTRPGPNTLDPLVLFTPGGFTRKPQIFPITLMANMSPSLLPNVLDILGQLARDHGASTLQAWGVNEEEEVIKRWVELGGQIESRMRTREWPYGWCWYGPKGSRGRLVGCEMWTLN